VAEHHVANEKLAQHRRADFTGKCAGFFPMHVLGAQLHVLHPAQPLAHPRQRRERRDEHNLRALFSVDFEQERFEERVGLVDRHVHLPVRGENFFTHGKVEETRGRAEGELSLRAARYRSGKTVTPGRASPSSNSSDAPPPVLMKVI
jgi:hypothetical protein